MSRQLSETTPAAVHEPHRERWVPHRHAGDGSSSCGRRAPRPARAAPPSARRRNGASRTGRRSPSSPRDAEDVGPEAHRGPLAGRRRAYLRELPAPEDHRARRPDYRGPRPAPLPLPRAVKPFAVELHEALRLAHRPPRRDGRRGDAVAGRARAGSSPGARASPEDDAPAACRPPRAGNGARRETARTARTSPLAAPSLTVRVTGVDPHPWLSGDFPGRWQPSAGCGVRPGLTLFRVIV